MIWLLIFGIVIIASFVLALRSMRGYQELPIAELSYTLFLIRNKKGLNSEFFERLSSYLKNVGGTISLERLTKGGEVVHVIYAPSEFGKKFTELDLIELEDYLIDSDQAETSDNKKVKPGDSFAWIIAPKNNSKKELVAKDHFLKMLDLSPDQRFFWQIVCQSLNPTDFQVTIRAMVIDPDHTRRMELAKKLDFEISECTGLIKMQKQPSSSAVFKSFQVRTLIPKEVSSFILKKDEILSLLAV